MLILIDGRPELVGEVRAARSDLREYLQDELSQLVEEPYFDYAVDSAAGAYGPLGIERAKVVRRRVDQLVSP